MNRKHPKLLKCDFFLAWIWRVAMVNQVHLELFTSTMEGWTRKWSITRFLIFLRGRAAMGREFLWRWRWNWGKAIEKKEMTLTPACGQYRNVNFCSFVKRKSPRVGQNTWTWHILKTSWTSLASMYGTSTKPPVRSCWRAQERRGWVVSD